MTARALPALRPRWLPLKVGGAWNPALRDLADKASGVYVVRRKADGVVLYVGESRTGRLWKTLIRHFQDWSSLPEHFYDRDGNRRRGAETFQHKRPELLESAIFVTSRGARSRAEGDQAALDLQARAIAKFQPATNVDDGRAEVGPFEQAEEDDYFSQFSRENPGDVFAAVARERADREARIAAWVARHGTRPFDAQGRGGVHLLVSPDPSKAGRWRVTRFEGETPIGHTEAATFEDAARLCEREYGGRVPDVRVAKNPSKRARLEVPRGELVTLGALVEISARREDGQIAVWRWSLRNAPALAYDARGRLFVVYGGRVVGRASDKARREYRRAHWGVPGRGYSLEGSILGGTARTVGEGVSVTYATQKGADLALVDYVHAWGDGARGAWSAPRVCQEGDRVAFVGGTYRVNDRGIVG